MFYTVIYKYSNIVESYTKKWLNKNQIPYDKIVINAQNKLIVAKQNNIAIFIDDSIEHCTEVQNGGIKTFLFTTICNQNIETPNLKRVYSWPQIYSLITK